jgi:hypothetical protein
MRTLIALIFVAFSLSACATSTRNVQPDLAERLRQNNAAFEDVNKEWADWNIRYQALKKEEKDIRASFTIEQLRSFTSMIQAIQAESVDDFNMHYLSLRNSLDVENAERFDIFCEDGFSLRKDRQRLVDRSIALQRQGQALLIELQLARQQEAENARSSASFWQNYQAAQQNRKLDQMKQSLDYLETVHMNPGVKVIPPPRILDWTP